MQTVKPHIPIIDISPLLSPDFTTSSLEVKQLAEEFYSACHTWGFFYVVGHNVPVELQKKLFACAKQFFALPLEQKQALSVRNGGLAWRGYMPIGGEGTHGRVDHKEGLYMGPEHPDTHPKIGLPLHGKNQFPDKEIPEFRPTALQYVDEIVELGKTLCDLISLSLGLDCRYVREHFLQPEPFALFRCFHYPAKPKEQQETWGIGEHTDFGLLTILNQESEGLQILSPHNEWVDAPVIENSFICNVGDMLDMLTGGRFKSRPHRVLVSETHDRISFPFFFDFSWDAEMKYLPLDHLPALSEEEREETKRRWEKTTFRSVEGTWSQYLAKKVRKVFPTLLLRCLTLSLTWRLRHDFQLSFHFEKEMCFTCHIYIYIRIP
jgi:isopenicillin N synthase-like dioxygenase